MFQYYIKIVPTVYEPLDSAVINTNQFSVPEYYRTIDHHAGGHGIPGAELALGSKRLYRLILSRIVLHV